MPVSIDHVLLSRVATLLPFPSAIETCRTRSSSLSLATTSDERRGGRPETVFLRFRLQAADHDR